MLGLAFGLCFGMKDVEVERSSHYRLESFYTMIMFYLSNTTHILILHVRLAYIVVSKMHSNEVILFFL